MGIIYFQSHDENHRTLFSTIFSDLHSDEDLESIHINDTITITLDIDPMTYFILKENIVAGVRVHKKYLRLEDDDAEFEAEFDFEVIKRVHNVSKDWMNDAESPRASYRSSSTTAYVQATSREAQELFFKIQGIKVNNQNI